MYSAWTENTLCVFRVKTSFSNFAGIVWAGPVKTVHGNISFAIAGQCQKFKN